MPLLCNLEKRRSPTEFDVEDEGDEDGQGSRELSIWQDIPDSILLHIFSFLEVPHLGNVAQTCKTWHRVSEDESLWKQLFNSTLSVSARALPTGKTSWQDEVKRVTYHVPSVLTETLTEHTDEVLHVSFAHNGTLFSTTSKDATLKIWEVGYPTKLKYSKDFRELLAWDFTQFSSFNESDTMVLVSSVKSTPLMDRRGYMAILSLVHGFEILRVVTMDPSQLFGAWLDDTTFLGGSLEISLDRFATTVQIEAHAVPEIFSPLPSPAPLVSVEESSGKPLFTFSSETASLIKFLTVANLMKDGQGGKGEVTNASFKDLSINNVSKTFGDEEDFATEMSVDVTKEMENVRVDLNEKLNSESRVIDDSRVLGQDVGQEVTNDHMESCSTDVADEVGKSSEASHSSNSDCNKQVCRKCGKNIASANRILGDVGICECDFGFKVAELGKAFSSSLERPHDLNLHKLQSHSAEAGTTSVKNENNREKNLIIVTGEFAVALHQIGFKNVTPYTRESVLANGATPMDGDNPEGFMVVNYSNNDIHIVHRQQKMDTPDHLVDLFGHVTGLCLTPDQRYLFINCRPWVGDIDRADPWMTPDLSTNIEVRIIDLHTLKDLGIRYKGHKGFSPPNMCCFVFLDVSQDYVASGSEDSKGYLWDRHFQSLLSSYNHESGVVNAVGFCPANQEYLVTVSDDKTIKVWRSKSEVKRLNLNPDMEQDIELS